MTDFGRMPSHKASHQSGGSDEINCTGLVGVAAAGILGDGTAGRVLRVLDLLILNGTEDNTLQLIMASLWNGDEQGPQDNLGKGDSTTNYNLNGGGDELTINGGALTGSPVAVVAHSAVALSTGTVYTLNVHVTAGNIMIYLFNATTGDAIVLTDAVELGYIDLHIAYLTDE